MEIEDLLHEFWNRKSDACPLEASEQEKQEKEFAEWVKQNIYNNAEMCARPMIRFISEHYDSYTEAVIADAGYCILKAVECKKIEDYIKE